MIGDFLSAPIIAWTGCASLTFAPGALLFTTVLSLWGFSLEGPLQALDASVVAPGTRSALQQRLAPKAKPHLRRPMALLQIGDTSTKPVHSIF